MNDWEVIRPMGERNYECHVKNMKKSVENVLKWIATAEETSVLIPAITAEHCLMNNVQEWYIDLDGEHLNLADTLETLWNAQVDKLEAIQNNPMLVDKEDQAVERERCLNEAFGACDPIVSLTLIKKALNEFLTY